VILLDANLLLYAHNTDSPAHAAATDWLDAQLSGTTRVGLPWPTLLAFLRIASNPRVFARPVSVAGAWAQVERWLSAPVAWIPLPSARHPEALASMLAATPGADHVPDAHLAALAVEHGLELCTCDRGFARFPGLRWRDPLT